MDRTKLLSPTPEGIDEAARLLRETDLPVMDVGFTVGFDNFSYFIKRFRSVYGVSPSHYRKG